MRRLILLLIFTALATLVVVLPLRAPSLDGEVAPELTIEPPPTRTPGPTPTFAPVTPPAQSLSEGELIARAAETARWNGLETFDGPAYIKWETLREQETWLGVHSGTAQELVVFTVAFRGSGIFRGFGSGFGGDLSMDGFTITMNPMNGYSIVEISGFRAPPNAVQIDASRFGISTPELE